MSEYNHRDRTHFGPILWPHYKPVLPQVGLVLGTLGRQGSVGVLEEIEKLLQQRGGAAMEGAEMR